MQRNKAMLSIAAFLVSAGIGVFIFGYQQMQKARASASASWPTVTGIVISSEVETRTKSEDAGRRIQTTYLPRVEYVYSVNGVEHQSHKFSIQLTDHKTHRGAEEDLIAFPEGGEAMVYYDPEDPGSSAIKAGSSLKDHLITFLVAAGMMAVGVATVFTRPKG